MQRGGGADTALARGGDSDCDRVDVIRQKVDLDDNGSKRPRRLNVERSGCEYAVVSLLQQQQQQQQ
jgi:hypothetical protein